VTGTDPVDSVHGRALHSRYHGFVLVYDAAGGQLLSTCLGTACARPQ